MPPLDLNAVAFGALALLTLGSAGGVAFSSNIIYSTIALLGTFMGIAGMYVQLSADFLAATQVLVYVGGTLTLILFAVMLTARIEDIRTSNSAMNRGVAGALVILAGASSVAGASYLFVWPALALSGVVGASRTTAGDESPRNVMMGVASALPGLLILVPLVRAVYEGLGLGGAGGPAVAVVVALVVLSLAQALSVFLGARVPYAASMIMPMAAIPFDRS